MAIQDNVGRRFATGPVGADGVAFATEKSFASLHGPGFPLKVARTHTRYARPETKSAGGAPLVPLAGALWKMLVTCTVRSSTRTSYPVAPVTEFQETVGRRAACGPVGPFRVGFGSGTVALSSAHALLSFTVTVWVPRACPLAEMVSVYVPLATYSAKAPCCVAVNVLVKPFPLASRTSTTTEDPSPPS